MDLATLKTRIERGEEYLLALEEARNREWKDTLVEYDEGRLALPQAMALVHPDFYRDREEQVGQSIRGPRQFSTNVGRQVSVCMADRIWLSACPLESPDNIHADHWFPYALGGPTVSENQLFLCPAHNRVKASDIHLFPWELGEPGWLRRQIDRIRRLLL